MVCVPSEYITMSRDTEQDLHDISRGTIREHRSIDRDVSLQHTREGAFLRWCRRAEMLHIIQYTRCVRS